MRPRLACARGIRRAAARRRCCYGPTCTRCNTSSSGPAIFPTKWCGTCTARAGGWAFVLWGLVFLQFVIPFFAMLFGPRQKPADSAAGDRRRHAGAALRRIVPAGAARRRCAAGPFSGWQYPPRSRRRSAIFGSSLQFMLARMERSAPDTRALPAAEISMKPIAAGQHEHRQRRRKREPSLDRQRVDAFGGIEAVAQQAQVIGECPDLSIARLRPAPAADRPHRAPRPDSVRATRPSA